VATRICLAWTATWTLETEKGEKEEWERRERGREGWGRRETIENESFFVSVFNDIMALRLVVPQLGHCADTIRISLISCTKVLWGASGDAS
jgi:hypothetical protein